ncbi:hypothetical protein AKJ16_DCAP26861 [Drosera capensis]
MGDHNRNGMLWYIPKAHSDIQAVSNGFLSCGDDGTVKLVQLQNLATQEESSFTDRHFDGCIPTVGRPLLLKGELNLMKETGPTTPLFLSRSCIYEVLRLPGHEVRGVEQCVFSILRFILLGSEICIIVSRQSKQCEYESPHLFASSPTSISLTRCFSIRSNLPTIRFHFRSLELDVDVVEVDFDGIVMS